MDIRKFDLVVIITMTVAIISMAFTFPALGLTSAGASETDIPEFDIDSSRFNFAGQFPENPGTPSQGDLEVPVGGGDDLTLHENSSHLVTMSAIDDAGTEDLTPEVYLNQYNDTSSSPEQVNVTLDSAGDSDVLDAFGYEIGVEWTQTLNTNQSDETAVIRYEISDQPGGEGWLTRIPVVGGIISAGEQLAQIVGWIGSIIWWGLTFVVEMGLNLIGLLFDVSTYFVDTLAWLTGTYAEVVSSANAWAGVFVAIPGILLFGEFAKIALVLISLLPTT